MRAILQVNARGTWSHVVEFDAAALRPVTEAATILQQALSAAHDKDFGGGASFRIVKAGTGRSPKVLVHIGQRKR